MAGSGEIFDSGATPTGEAAPGNPTENKGPSGEPDSPAPTSAGTDPAKAAQAALASRAGYLRNAGLPGGMDKERKHRQDEAPRVNTGNTETDRELWSKRFRASTAAPESSRIDDDVATALRIAENLSRAFANSADSGTATAPSPRPANWPDCAFADTEGEPATVAFLASLCALETATTVSIEEAVRPLEKALSALVVPPKSDSGGTGRLELPRSRRRLLEQFRAQAFFMPESPTDQRLGFISREEAAEALTYAWSDLSGGIGEAVRNWMVGLGSSYTAEIRATIGSAAGRLLVTDFAGLKRGLIDHWIKAETRLPHDAIDAAITVAANKGLSRQVADMVADWARRGNFDEVVAAGSISRGEFSRRYPDIADNVVKLLAERKTADAHNEAIWTIEWGIQWAHRNPSAGPRALNALARIGQAKDWEVRYGAYLITLGLLDALAKSNRFGRNVHGALNDQTGRSAMGSLAAVGFDTGSLELTQLQIDDWIRDSLLTLLVEAVKKADQDAAIWIVLDAVADAVADRPRVRSYLRNWLLKRREIAAQRYGGEDRLKRLDEIIKRIPE